VRKNKEKKNWYGDSSKVRKEKEKQFNKGYTPTWDKKVEKIEERKQIEQKKANRGFSGKIIAWLKAE